MKIKMTWMRGTGPEPWQGPYTEFTAGSRVDTSACILGRESSRGRVEALVRGLKRNSPGVPKGVVEKGPGRILANLVVLRLERRNFPF